MRRIALHAGLCLLLLACTPPASTMSQRPECSSRTASSTAISDDAQAASMM